VRAEEDCEQEQDAEQVLEDNDEDDGSSLSTPAMLEKENCIADATLHVQQSIAMREMAREHIALTQFTAHLPHLECLYGCTIDYAQNLMTLNLGDTQPGNTYYFSQKNVYIFGIANISIKPTTTLVSYVNQEETDRKGANNVASSLCSFLKKE
jgi:hypothetical protein